MMVIREVLKKNAPAPGLEIDTPHWVLSGSETTKRLYRAAESEYLRVAGLIEAGEASSPKSRRLVRATIACKTGYDRSLLNPRRQFELCDWIDRKNQELEELYSLHKPLARPSNDKSKRDLQEEISYLRKQEKERAESDHRAIVEAFFNSNMLDDRNVLRQQNSRLRNENTHMSDTIARLQKQLRDDEKQIAQLWEILDPAQRIKLGWRSNSE